ncbi:DUF4142 domain-containing protein [Sphingomonas bacterium]|uniref:DUF4142 domain-containing protein n=1 Tax=Sphingomonas bacterium TaxID=1895847 RepID=UPI001576FD8B|nr:DUF4142 domain-containing protein [Sphingomonas bacterium]
MFRALAFCTAIALPVAAFAAAAIPAGIYVAKAGASDKFEITSSNLVMDSTNPKVHDFAAMMVTDHTKSTEDVKAAAMQAGLKPKPPVLSPAQSAMIAKLKKVNGPARDQMYIEQQKTSHDQALALQQAYSTDGKSAPLKAVAANIVPVVQNHIQMLQAM